MTRRADGKFGCQSCTYQATLPEAVRHAVQRQFVVREPKQQEGTR